MIVPVFVQRRFGQVAVCLRFGFGVYSDPAGLAFHTYGITVDNALIDEIINVGTVRRHKRHELVIHRKFDNCLESLHADSFYWVTAARFVQRLHQMANWQPVGR